jgi:hypothetical protein
MLDAQSLLNQREGTRALSLSVLILDSKSREELPVARAVLPFLVSLVRVSRLPASAPAHVSAV